MNQPEQAQPYKAPNSYKAPKPKYPKLPKPKGPPEAKWPGKKTFAHQDKDTPIYTEQDLQDIWAFLEEKVAEIFTYVSLRQQNGSDYMMEIASEGLKRSGARDDQS
jgi:hypothetical protein